MSEKFCVVCGRPIRTGWKYCYEHRNTPGYETSRRGLTSKQSAVLGGVVLLFFGFVLAQNTTTLCWGVLLIIGGLLMIYFILRKGEKVSNDTALVKELFGKFISSKIGLALIFLFGIWMTLGGAYELVKEFRSIGAQIILYLGLMFSLYAVGRYPGDFLREYRTKSIFMRIVVGIALLYTLIGVLITITSKIDEAIFPFLITAASVIFVYKNREYVHFHRHRTEQRVIPIKPIQESSYSENEEDLPPKIV